MNTTKINFYHLKNIGRHLLAATCLLMLSAFCLGQVNENTQPAQPDLSDINSMIENMQQMQNPENQQQNNQPLSYEQLAPWFPEALNGLTRTKIGQASGAIPNMLAVQATYNTIDQPEFIGPDGHSDEVNKMNKTIRVEVMDGAGPTGSQMLASMNMMSSMNFEKDDGREHQKVVDVNGIRAQETFDKVRIRTVLNFVYQNRFMIAITTTHMDPEECWSYVALLGLDSLSDLGE